MGKNYSFLKVRARSENLLTKPNEIFATYLIFNKRISFPTKNSNYLCNFPNNVVSFLASLLECDQFSDIAAAIEYR
jgi:hypothetical protein